MAEYIEREKAIEAVNNITLFGEPIGRIINFGENILRNIPAADVQPVVMCKDCRHRDPEDRKCDSGQLERAGCLFPVDDNYFCAYGERMDGGA